MSSSNFKAPSRISNSTGNLSALRADLVAGLERWDKENAGPNGTPPQSPTRRTSSQHSFPSTMSTSISQSLFHPQNQSVAGPKGPLSPWGRLSDGGPMLNLGTNGFFNIPLQKSPTKRSASIAEMDELSLPSKRPRHDDPKVPFVFVENVKLLHEDVKLSRQIFLDLVRAQDERALCGGHNPPEIFTMVPSIDPEELFGQRDSSPENSRSEYPFVPESEGDSIFGTWFSSLLNHEDGKTPREAKARSSQQSGDPKTYVQGELPHKGDRADAVEVAAACETKGDEVLPMVQPQLVEAVTDGSPFGAKLNQNPSSLPRNSKLRPQAAPVSSPMAQTPLNAMPKPSRPPKAKKSNSNASKKSNKMPEFAHAGTSSSGVIGSSLASPNTSKNPRPFAYSKGQAQKIWELAELQDYLGAHALFEESERVILIDGETKVQAWLDNHPKVRKRLEDAKAKNPNKGSPNEKTRKILYRCGASAVWKPAGDPKDFAAGPQRGYQLTYKRCKDHVYATIDNYKKHVYVHHLAKDLPSYRRKKGDRKTGTTKGDDKAQEKKKDRATENDAEDSEGGDDQDAD